MASATSTDLMRKEITDWMASRLGTATMVFGSGGVDGQGAVVSPDPAQINVMAPEGEFPIHGFTRVSDTAITVTGRLNKGDLVGIPISESGLKINGSLHAVRNFAAKTFEDDEYFDFNITIKF